MMQLWEHSPRTNVFRVRFLVSTSYVGWVCCWFSSLLRGVFLWELWFSPLRKNQHFPNSNSIWIQWTIRATTWMSTVKTRFQLLLIFARLLKKFLKKWTSQWYTRRLTWLKRHYHGNMRDFHCTHSVFLLALYLIMLILKFLEGHLSLMSGEYGVSFHLLT